MAAGTCKICGCTEERACAGGCSWVDETRELCSQCARAGDVAGPIVEIIGAVLQRAQRKTGVTWQDLTADEQQLTIMSCRGLLEGIAEVLDQDAVALALELADLTAFLEETFPDETTDLDEPVVAVVKRLLAPQVGKRIVLPPGARP